MPWSSRKARLVVVISLLLIVGFLATSFASFFVSRASLRSEVLINELPLTGDNIYSEIQKDLIRPVLISSFMASDTFLRDWVTGGEVDENRIVQYLKEVQVRYNTFTSFFVSEKTRTYYHSDGILKKVSPDEERDIWYFRVRKMKDDYEINVDPDLANKDAMTVFINYRVFDYDRNFIGATGVGLTVSAVKNLIEAYQEKFNRTIYFIDSKGAIKLSGMHHDTGTLNFSQDRLYDRFKDRLDSKSKSSFTYTRDGDLVYANIRYIEEFDWYLVVEQLARETNKEIFKTLVINLLICVFITLVVLLLVYLSVASYQARIETLRGIVPICSNCKQIRDDQGYWNMVEAYVEKHTEAQFSHSICPECAKKLYPGIKFKE